MVEKKLPFRKEELEEVANKYGTPFHIYDKKGIRDTAWRLNAAFSWVLKGFRNYYAVKACPNPFILEILKEEGMGADCSSDTELELASAVGFKSEDIMFTSNDTPLHEFKLARKLEAIVNLDDVSHIDFLEEHAGIPELICVRYNPGPARVGNSIIGNPPDAKYGFTREQVFRGLEKLRRKGVKRFGLHTMIASNELNPNYFIETAKMMFELVRDVNEKTNIKVEFVNLGGGIGIPYKPDQEEVDLKEVSNGIKGHYDSKSREANLHHLRIFMENGRLVTGPNGYLLTRVLHKKEIYRNFIGVDANMSSLMRPGMYGAYHHITVLGKEGWPLHYKYNVTGSICENIDQFAVDRMLPLIEIGDLLVIHDTGAHGYAMCFNYNGKKRPPEILKRSNGSFEMIRRGEDVKDLFRTFDFPCSRYAHLAK